MFSILESVAFDTGYAGSAGLVPQSWVNGNGTSYIYFGAGEFDGQGSGHDYLGTVRCPYPFPYRYWHMFIIAWTDRDDFCYLEWRAICLATIRFRKRAYSCRCQIIFCNIDACSL